MGQRLAALQRDDGHHGIELRGRRSGQLAVGGQVAAVVQRGAADLGRNDLHAGLLRHQRLVEGGNVPGAGAFVHQDGDRKSTRLNSSHLVISYAVFCLKKKNAVRMMTDPANADNRRLGINRLLDWDCAKREPFVTRYRYIAQNDRDQTVRAAAIRALNRCRDQRSTPIFVKGLSDKNDSVKLEACKALANVPDPAAAEPLTALVSSAETNLDVRIAAADALKYYRTLAVARA